MRIKIVTALAGAFACFCVSTGFSQGDGGPADRFLAAFQAFQKGSDLETSGDAAGAIHAFEDVARQLKEIRKAAPDWNPSIMDFRERKTAAAIARLRQQIAAGEGAGQAAALAGAGHEADIFLAAFLAFQKGAEEEGAGHPEEALQAYQAASAVLEEMKAAWPAWNPSVVQFRHTKTAEAIARLQKKAEPSPIVPIGSPADSEPND